MRNGGAVLAVLLTGCVLPGTGTGSGRGDAGAPAARDTSAAFDAQAPPVGVGCTTDALGVVWCRSVAQCPDVTVNAGLFPNCGFRARNSGLDLACWCAPGYVCPMGQPLSCEDARKLLNQQTELGVCVQVAENRCVSQADPKTSGPGKTGPSSCDMNCYRSCGPTAACKQVCGC